MYGLRCMSHEDDPRPLTRIDHVAQSMTPDEMPSWRLFYLSLFDFETTPQVDVIDPAGIVESLALQDEARTLRVCLNASLSRRTQSARTRRGARAVTVGPGQL